jgi:hypothetical protein
MTDVNIDAALFGKPVTIRTKAATIVGTLTASIDDGGAKSLIVTNAIRTLERDGHVDFIHELHLNGAIVKSIESTATRTPRLFRAKCGRCGYTIHVPETWAAKGFPMCVCGGRIVPIS